MPTQKIIGNTFFSRQNDSLKYKVLYKAIPTQQCHNNPLTIQIVVNCKQNIHPRRKTQHAHVH